MFRKYNTKLRYCVLLLLLHALLLPACSSKRKAARKAKAKQEAKATKKSSKQAQPSAAIAKAIKTARSYQGTPHRDGGTSRNGIDCSGLIMLACQAGGLQLPRTSAQQSTVGRPVHKSDIAVGDLIFFNTSGRGVSHVGLVTQVKDGVPTFIHTSSSLGVTETTLSNSYWAPRYVKAMRPW